MDQPQLTALELASEIKSLFQQLKESMKRSKLWDSDVEFLRQQVRRFQLQLLFKFPSEKESKETDNQLWMTTSHSFISSYKMQIAALDRDRQTAQVANGKGKPPKNVVEKRKLVQRFRQFLNAEEKFWRKFIARYASHFGLSDTKWIMKTLGSLDAELQEEDGDRNLFPEVKDTKVSEKRSDYDARLATVSKALICLGDLTRYREQQSEQTKTDNPNVRGRTGRPGGPSHRPSYSKSTEFYELSRSLVPDSGNSSHQMAILSNYLKDTFNAVYHYYRSLCVRHPYETAAENLQTTLNKATDSYLNNRHSAPEDSKIALPPKVMLEQLKEKVIVLHASWRMSSDSAGKKLPELQAFFSRDFQTLISDKAIPIEMITKIVIMAIGALWRIRLIKDSKKEPRDSASAENRIAMHLLGLCSSLFWIGVDQLADSQGPQSPGISSDLAFNITVVLRRMLPAIRICSKWMRAHTAYVLLLSSQPNLPHNLKLTLVDFWTSYQRFCSSLLKKFPKENLPNLSNPLEEDVDLVGFAPLKKSMISAASGSVKRAEAVHNQVHPNEEHLMRILDIINDGLEIASNEKSPISFQDEKQLFIFNGLERTEQRTLKPTVPQLPDVLMIPPSVASHALLHRTGLRKLDSKEDFDDDGATVSTRTDDDPVNLAMKATLESDMDDDFMIDDDDEIVYPKQSLATPPIQSFAAVSPRLSAISPLLQRPTLPTSSGSDHYPTSTLRQPPAYGEAVARATTDPGWTNAALPPLLFGSHSGDAPSIWSTSLDQRTPTKANAGANLSPALASIKLSSPVSTGSRIPSSSDSMRGAHSSRISDDFQANSPANFLSSTMRTSNPANFATIPHAGMANFARRDDQAGYYNPAPSALQHNQMVGDSFQGNGDPRYMPYWEPLRNS